MAPSIPTKCLMCCPGWGSGGQTVSTFLSAGLVDRLHVMVAPMIIGSGQPAFSLPEIDSLRDALRPEARMVNLGSDMLFDLALGGHR